VSDCENLTDDSIEFLNRLRPNIAVERYDSDEDEDEGEDEDEDEGDDDAGDDY
jgi:hypothetical protein